MDYLIDTHILIWCIGGNALLSKKVVKEIDSTQNKIFVSNATLWEIAIKVNLGKLNLGIPFDQILGFLKDKGFILLDFNQLSLNKLTQLPLHHRDPFDRLLICQAITQNLTIITDDSKFELYPVQLLS